MEKEKFMIENIIYYMMEDIQKEKKMEKEKNMIISGN